MRQRVTDKAISCPCGATRFRATGRPIMVAECYCESCRKAGALFETLSAASSLLEPGGGTRYVLQRKDRLIPETGAEHLREHRLTPASKTRRILAVCCNSPMFLDLSYAHWFSVYAKRFEGGDVAALDERTMLCDMPADFVPPSDARNSKTQSPVFFFRLLAAWTGMGFRIPAHDWVKGSLTVGDAAAPAGTAVI